MLNIWAVSLYLCGALFTISGKIPDFYLSSELYVYCITDSESISLISVRGLETGVRRSARQTGDYPVIQSKPRIVEYNLTRNYLVGSWLNINNQEKSIYEPLPTPLGLLSVSPGEKEEVESDKKVRMPNIMAEQNMTINPYYIDEEYFDKEKREYLYELGPEGEYH